MVCLAAAGLKGPVIRGIHEQLHIVSAKVILGLREKSPEGLWHEADARMFSPATANCLL